MKHIILISFVLMSLCVTAQNKPQLVSRKVPVGLYTEEFTTLASDTSVREGSYRLMYKGKAIEKGTYSKGKRTGRWTFYNLNNEIEFIYDYEEQRPYQILPHQGQIYTSNTFPCMYLGSPLVPFHYIAAHTYYPVKESENTKDCPVVLALEVSPDGRMTGYHLEKSSRDDFNNVVLKAAASIPDTWRFVPARKNGRNVPGIYRITLIFEAVD